MDGAKEPLHLTYRAVGSSTGILDFVGDLVNETMVPRNDFGSGDVPIPTDDYNLLTNQFGIEMLHLPVVLGAISFFHSVPNVPKLELTSCLLARIMSRDIKTWTHPDIAELNPNIRELIGSDLAITVGRRNLGSSSTASITKVCVVVIVGSVVVSAVFLHALILTPHLFPVPPHYLRCQLA